MKKSFIISMTLSIIATIIAIWFIMTTEGDIPIHWNIRGEIDGYGSSLTLLIFPVTSLLVTLLLYFVPNIDPKGDNIKKSGPILQITMILITILMLGVEIILIRAINGADILSLNTFIMLLIGILFIALGYYMPGIKQNYMMGLKTPWTLHSEKVWTKTHKVSKNWFISAGGLYLIGALLPNPYGLIIALIFTIVVVIGIVIYSYLLFVEEKKKK